MKLSLANMESISKRASGQAPCCLRLQQKTDGQLRSSLDILREIKRVLDGTGGKMLSCLSMKVLFLKRQSEEKTERLLINNFMYFSDSDSYRDLCVPLL